MCLDKGQLVQLEEDKIVYKWVISDENGIHPVYVKNNKCYDKKNVNIATFDDNLFKVEYTTINNHQICATKNVFNGGHTVSIGAFHSFENYRDALYNYPAPIHLWPFEDTKKYSLWKCAIPKGSNVVFKGIYDSIYPAYASSHLKFIEEIKL